MIPVFEPELGEEEVKAVADAVRNGEISGTFGNSIPDFETEFASYCGSRYGIAVTSGTVALYLAVHAAGIGHGDEVLISASTNIATALAVYHNGAIPIPIDSENVTWNLDLDQIEDAITPHTKAIIPVHLFGHAVDMDRCCEIANQHNLLIIEDAAEAQGATVRGRKAGTFGQMGCFSFYANKHITTGEGGMILTDDQQLAEKLRLLRNLAFTTPRFRHEVAGFNFRMTGLQAALGSVQLRKLDKVIEKKRRLAATYKDRLKNIPGLQLPVELPWAFHVYWMFPLVVEPVFGKSRDELAKFLRERGIDTRTFFCPMNLQPCFADIPASVSRKCPVAESIWDSGLYLPSSTGLTDEQITFIANTIRAARSA